MGNKYFSEGDIIETNDQKYRFKLLDSVRYNGKFYIAHVQNLISDQECLVKYVKTNTEDVSYKINNLTREGGFRFCYPYIEYVYGNFKGTDPEGMDIYGVVVEYIHGIELYDYRRILEKKILHKEIGEREAECLIYRQMMEFLYGMNYYTQFAEDIYLHRDFRPENIMITDDDHIKIIDFDFAHISENTKTGRVINWDLPFSTGYSSPEIYIQDTNIKGPNLSTEIYAAGRLFFFWLNGCEYYTPEQKKAQNDPITEGVIPDTAPYCSDPSLRYGIQKNINRFNPKFLEKEYEPLINILDRMCRASNDEERYLSVIDIIHDMQKFLVQFYDESELKYMEDFKPEKLQFLPEDICISNRKSKMVAYKIQNGIKTGAPLYEYSMRDIIHDNRLLLSIYYLNDKVCFIAGNGIKIEHKHGNGFEDDIFDIDDQVLFDQDIVVADGIEIQFSIK